ncbi:hypothetical protein MPLDJ20_230128 [Mesorhizobium plurifarium]|uniref:Uncharacterized protein n=1 Tax=Mesorhizobium plurifarium TaxID=69974 RepID=A0A090FAN2_MESPL|nr:hypothetical protein MPLDJ20_230128 [Mesorhizobium plurifarium]
MRSAAALTSLRRPSLRGPSLRGLGGRVDDDLPRIVELHGEHVLGLHASRIDRVEEQGVRLDLLAQFGNILLMLLHLVLDGRRRPAFAARGIDQEHDVDRIELGGLAHRADVVAGAVDGRNDLSGLRPGKRLFLPDIGIDDCRGGLVAVQGLRRGCRMGRGHEKRGGNHGNRSCRARGIRHHSLLTELVAGRKQRNGPAWLQVPFKSLPADREAARPGLRSARFLGDQRQRAIGLHAGGNHLRRAHALGFERGFHLGRGVDRFAQGLQAGIAALRHDLVDLRLRVLGQFGDVDDVDALDRRHGGLSFRGGGRSRRRAGLRRRLLLSARGTRHHQGGGRGENYRFAHGYSFHRLGSDSARLNGAMGTPKLALKVSPGGSLRDHWVATMCARYAINRNFGSNC